MDEETKNAIAAVAAQLKEGLEKVGSTVQATKDQLIGQFTRQHSELEKKVGSIKIPEPPPAPKPEEKKEEKKEETGTIGELTKKITEMQDQLKREKAVAEIQKAVADKTWYDINEPIGEIQKVIKTRDDGTLYVPGERDVAGVKVPNAELTLKEAVENLAKVKSHWLKKTVQGGIDARGGTGQPSGQQMTVGWEPKTLKEAMANPDRWYALKKENPALAEKLQRENKR